jgi:hypothetical protein
MVRNSNEKAGAKASKASAKRQTPPPATTSLPKRPKRQSTSKPAPTESDYFLHESSDAEDGNGDSDAKSAVDSSSEPDSMLDEDELESSEISEIDESTIKKNKRPRGPASAKPDSVKARSNSSRGQTAQSTKSELWRPGVPTGSEPGTQVIIKKPKARDAGKTPYTDSTIHPNTMLFLKDLAANNDRGWLKSEFSSLKPQLYIPAAFCSKFNSSWLVLVAVYTYQRH